MGTGENPSKACPPKLVISAKALKLAEKWVDCMSKCSADEEQQEYEGRPSRLGLGAKVVRQSQFCALDGPIERKLQSKLNAGKRKASQLREEEIVPTTGDTDDASEDDEDSRTKAFSKRRAAPATATLKAKKK